MPLSQDAHNQVDSFQQAGKTVMWVAVDNAVAGLIALAYTLRSEALPAMKALKQRALEHTIMLTGDNTHSASVIVAEVGLTDYHANLMPEDKLTVISDLIKNYGQVAMIGNGVNDALALANATVGIAMGGAGTDIALETADVALMGDDLSKLPFAVGLGRATRAIIVQNLVISLGVITLLFITSLTGFVSIGIAIIFHEGSTLVVVMNALRLLRYKRWLKKNLAFPDEGRIKNGFFVISNNVEIPQVLSNDAGLIRREKVDFDLVLGGK